MSSFRTPPALWTALLYLGGCAAAAALSHPSLLRQGWLVGAALLGLAAATTGLLRLVRLSRAADERTRLRAYRIAYDVVASLMILYALYRFRAVREQARLPPDAPRVDLMFWVVLLLGTTLPTAVASLLAGARPSTGREQPERAPE